MDILKALSLVESAGNRPLDQINGDQQPSGVEDPSGGAGGLGADTKRPADQLQGDGPDAPQAPIQDVTPDNVIPESASLSDKFASLMNESLSNYSVDIKAAAAPLFESIELDEEFAAKAISVFEAAINESAKAHLVTLNKVAGDIMEKILSARVKTLEEQVDRHMNHVVTEWATENRLAIEQGVRVQVAESLMEGMKKLLEDHYVELPENKKDLYEAAIEKGDEILSKYNEEHRKAVALSEEVQKLNKKLIIESASSGMVATKAEKFRTMAEAIDFSDEFKIKIDTLKEEMNRQATPTVSQKSEAVTEDLSPLIEEFHGDKREKQVDRMVENYIRFLDRK